MIRFGALVFAAALSGSCARAVPRKMDFSETAQAVRVEEYPQVQRAWTRDAKLVRDVGTVIEAWATAKSWQFRQAYIEQYAAIYNLGAAERKALHTAQLDAARASWEFHVTVQTTKHEWNDLEKQDSPWRITLLDAAGNELAPTSVEAPDLPELYEATFFPSRTEFSRTFVIRFERASSGEAGFRGPSSGGITLRIAGPLGRIDLRWDAL